MADAEPLSTDRGEQMVATFTYPAGELSGVAEFVVRAKVGDADPPILKILSTDAPGAAAGLVTIAGQTVTVTVNGPATQALPAASSWALWLNPGALDAQVISGSLRVYEVVQP